MAQFLWIPWRLPKLNELLDARIRVYTPKGGKSRGGATRKHMASLPNAYTVMKREWEGIIWTHARNRGFCVAPGCWDFTYLFVEPDARFDPSNISSAAVKFIEDALQGTKLRPALMDGDGWGTVHSHHFEYASQRVEAPNVACPGVLLGYAKEPIQKPELLQQAETMSNAERFHRRANTVHATAARKSAALRGGVPGGNQPVGEAPAGSPATPGAGLRAQRAAGDGRGPTTGNPGK